MTFAGLDALNEIKAFLSANLKNVSVKTVWEEKSVGLGTSNYDQVFIGLDAEDPAIFSLQYEDTDGTPAWDWLHTVSFLCRYSHWKE